MKKLRLGNRKWRARTQNWRLWNLDPVFFSVYQTAYFIQPFIFNNLKKILKLSVIQVIFKFWKVNEGLESLFLSSFFDRNILSLIVKAIYAIVTKFNLLRSTQVENKNSPMYQTPRDSHC